MKLYVQIMKAVQNMVEQSISKDFGGCESAEKIKRFLCNTML